MISFEIFVKYTLLYLFAHWYLVWNKEPLMTNVKMFYTYLLLCFYYKLHFDILLLHDVII